MKLKYNELIFDVNGDLNNYYTKDECDNKYAKLDQSNTFNARNYFTCEKERNTQYGISIYSNSNDLDFNNHNFDSTVLNKIVMTDKNDNHLGIIQFMQGVDDYYSFEFIKQLADESGNLTEDWDGIRLLSKNNRTGVKMTVPYTTTNSDDNECACARFVNERSFGRINTLVGDIVTAPSSFIWGNDNDYSWGVLYCQASNINGNYNVNLNGGLIISRTNLTNESIFISIPFKPHDYVQFNFDSGQQRIIGMFNLINY